MANKLHFVLVNDSVRSRACDVIANHAPDGYHVIVQEPDRTLEQNATQWPYLAGFSQQKMWPVNGVMVKMSMDEWKDVLTAAFEKDTNPRLAAGLDGGIVMLGRRTSKFGKKKFSDWIEWLKATAALMDIKPIFKYGNNNEPDQG